jgi:hypothetical protein
MSAGGTSVPSTPEERRLVFEQFLRCIDREENLIHYRMSWGLQCNLAFFAGIIALQQLDLKYQLGSYILDLKSWADMGVAILGGVASVLSTIGIRAAHTQTEFLKRQLAKRLRVASDHDWENTEFIRPYGEWDIHKAARKISAIIPLLFIGFWVLVFAWAYKKI